MPIPCSHRSSAGFLHGHSIFYPSSEVKGADTKSFGPFGNTQGLAVMSEHFVSSAVSGLLFYSTPLAVARSVITVIVDSIYRMLRGGRIAHVGVEIRERVSPPVANGNPSSPIVPVVLVSGPVASGEHSAPSNIRHCSMHSVLRDTTKKTFFLKAAARLRIATPKYFPGNLFLGAALTLAKPHKLLGLVFPCVTKNSPSANLLPGHVLYLLAVRKLYNHMRIIAQGPRS